MSVTALPRRSPTVTVEAATERFLAQPDLGEKTVAAYTAAVERFTTAVGADRGSYPTRSEPAPWQLN